MRSANYLNELEKLARDRAILTSIEAARLAGYTPDHVCLLSRTNVLSAEKKGRDWLVKAESLYEYVKTKPHPGRKRR